MDSELALPVISNVKMNEYLKELGNVAEINEPIRQVYFIGSETITARQSTKYKYMEKLVQFRIEPPQGE